MKNLGICLLSFGILIPLFVGALTAGEIDLSKATVVVTPSTTDDDVLSDTSVAKILIEEVAKRTGITLKTFGGETSVLASPVIVLTSQREVMARTVPFRSGGQFPENQKDGYRIFIPQKSDLTVVLIIGNDPRGLLYGVGEFLRNMKWRQGEAKLSIDDSLDKSQSPAYPIRGHQIGYRAHAHSWDAWTAEQFDRYFRELALQGNNSIENIPFQDERQDPLFKMTRTENNILQSELCRRYGLDYWVWVPITIDLTDKEKRAEHLKMHEEFYKICPKLDALYFPGGDPGDNPANLVIAFLEDVAVILEKYHPNVKIWLSLQQFSLDDQHLVFNYLREKSPDWFGGLVNGPSSGPIPFERNMLPEKYQFRLYPDICHNRVCQYEVRWWDVAHAKTLGREAINPRPVEFAYIHNWFAPYSDGFISYSDGCGDDVNKTVWTNLAFNPDKPVRQILVDYANFFFGSDLANAVADGILALEKNWEGALIHNASVEGTLRLWQDLEKAHPELSENWRWQMCLVRAYYDCYNRRRLVYETELENEANAILLQSETLGADAAMKAATDVLLRAKNSIAPDLRQRIIDLYDDLFKSIQLQSSVPKYGASGSQRGASLDFIDVPLNNLFWLEDQFAKIGEISSEKEKCDRLKFIALWENPGPGSFFDDIGNPAKSDRVLHSTRTYTKPGEYEIENPMLWWHNDGRSRDRLSQQVTMAWPKALVYEGLDPKADYVFRVSGYGTIRVKMNGIAVKPVNEEKVKTGEFVDFIVPRELTKDRHLEITFIPPTDEDDLNWRQKSYLAEAWLLKQ